MRPEITDVRRRLEYGQTHDMVRGQLAVVLWGILVGLFLLTSFNGKPISGRHAFGGGLAIALALAYLGVLVYRRAQPSIPSIVLSRDGVLFRLVSERVIPWDEIEEVGFANISAPRDFFSTCVTKIVVSQSFFKSIAPSVWMESVIARGGDPSEIYLAYYTPPPYDEFQAAIRCRWQAFSRHARGSTAQPEVRPAPPVSVSTVRPRSGAIQRAESFAGVRALAALIRDSSPGQLLLSAVALAGIVALATNIAGFWSTAGQIEGRAESEKWRQWHKEQSAERKAFDAELQRTRDRMDRAFKCMNESFERRSRGISTNDPECERDGK